ncbi:MAG TPA: heme exporter protein CcmB [Xanthobacteraceae bacterium]|nr:heme exporter protein CcmB [Xanthobacteraceae bacterium]
MMETLRAVFLRDLKIAFRAGGGAGLGVVFFLALITVVPFAVGPDMPLLARIGPAILWIGALLATLLGLDRIFSADREDGSLDVMMLSATPLEMIAAAKGAAHWVATGLPLTVAAPLFGLLLGVEPSALGTVTLTLLIGTPAITFLGLIGAALAVALPRGGLLVAVLILPLTIPVLIFGVAASAGAGLVPFDTSLKFVAALTLFALVLGPVASAVALRHIRQ